MSKSRKLDSDELGQKGEARFREICSDARLVCNKAEYDRMGWDFIVEFRFDTSDAGVSLDKRATPLSCHVQVKTIWADNDTFSMLLSAIERLAKDPKPSFIYVLKIDKDLQPVAAYLIPLLDDALAKVLRRLRAATKKGQARINKSKIKFPVPRGRRIACSGEALRAAIIAACGPDLEAAMRMKAEQLKSLGFEANAYQAETTFMLADASEIADVLLGLKPVNIENFEGSETRFGITLPLSGASGSGVMHITPESADRCQVVVRGPEFALPASIPGKIFVPAARLDRSVTKYLIRAALFDIEVTQRGMQLNIKPGNLKSAKLLLTDWIHFFRMMAIFSGQSVTFDIVPVKWPRATITTKIGVFPGHEQSARILRAFESVDVLFRLAGVEACPVLLDEILPADERCVAIAGLFSGSDDVQPLRFTPSWPAGTLPNEMDVLYIDAVQVAGVKLAFSCIATMFHKPGDGGKRGVPQWTSRTVKAREIVSIRNYSEDYEKFAKRSKTETGIDAVMMATYDEEGRSRA